MGQQQIVTRGEFTRGLPALLGAALLTTLITSPLSAAPRVDQSSVNKSIRIAADSVNGAVDSVNGSIDVGANATVGSIDSVNGSVRLGDGAVADSLESVNGTIRLGENVEILRNLETVNGAVRTEPGARIRGSLSTVNGNIELDGALLEGDLSTYSGAIVLTNTVVAGDLYVRQSKGSQWFGRKRNRPIRVEIGPGSTVQGGLFFEHPVELHLSDDAVVGEIHGERAILE